MPGTRRSTASCARCRHDRANCAAAGTRSRSSRPISSARCPCAVLSRNPPRAGRSARDRPAARAVRARRHAYRHRRPAGHGRRGDTCLRARLPFTTAYHTQFPDYIARRTGICRQRCSGRIIRRFHAPAARIMVATETIARSNCARQGIGRLHHWSRGVRSRLFHPEPPAARPVLRPAASDPALCRARGGRRRTSRHSSPAAIPGTKVVVGDGPALEQAAGAISPTPISSASETGDALAGCYAGADVFVFPSRTDTFGLVMIEALACGTPVAAYPVPGPLDVLDAGGGVMAEDLEEAIARRPAAAIATPASGLAAHSPGRRAPTSSSPALLRCSRKGEALIAPSGLKHRLERSATVGIRPMAGNRLLRCMCQMLAVRLQTLYMIVQRWPSREGRPFYFQFGELSWPISPRP